MVKLLLVDDEYTEREGILYLLRKFEMELDVHEEPNGADALAYLQRVRDVNIIMTDIEMPYMNGIEFLEAASRMFPEIKSIIFSAYGEFEYARAAIECNVSGYILKPVKVEEFRRVMRKVLPKQTDVVKGEAGSGEKRKIVKMIQEIVGREYRKDIGLEYLAQKVYLSPCYLSTLFKKETGISLVKYINEYRLQEAKRLLSTTNRRVNDISVEVGFDNLPYFCTVFKEKFGMTPAKFRESE